MTIENKIANLANHRSFYDATLDVKCEEKNGSIYWYEYDDSNLKKVTTKVSRGCGRITRHIGNSWKRIGKKVAAEILSKFGITLEQFIAYTNEEPELMNELNEQKAEEERVETLNFFLSTPLTDIDSAIEVEIANQTTAEEIADEAQEFASETDEDAYEGRELTHDVDLFDGMGIAEAEGIDFEAEDNSTYKPANKAANIPEIGGIEDDDLAEAYAGRELDCNVYMIEIPEISNTGKPLTGEEPALKTKKTRKKTSVAEQKIRWLENAKINENGKYYIVPEADYKNFPANKGWNPCFYIVTNDLKIKRIGLKFAIELAKSDKAIELSKDEVKKLKKAA